MNIKVQSSPKENAHIFRSFHTATLLLVNLKIKKSTLLLKLQL